MAERAEPNDQAEATEKAEHHEPTDPMEKAEPTLPIEKAEPFEPIERNESSENSDHLLRRPCDMASRVVARPIMRCTARSRRRRKITPRSSRTWRSDSVQSYRGMSSPALHRTVTAERMVAGGLALSRDDDGRIVLVDGALPGERVRVEVRRKQRAERGEVLEVLEPSPWRVEPPCPHVAEGCGGCDWQHAETGLQTEMRVAIVDDALQRIGHLVEPVVRAGPPVDAEGTRTSLRLAVADGHLGLRHRGSHDVVPITSCLVTRPELQTLLAPGVLDPGDAHEVTLRVATGTGERMLVAQPTAAGVRAPADVLVVGGDELDDGRRAWMHTDVAGVRFRVSARSFLQASTAGAEALVEVARQQLVGAPDGPFVDLYGGIGLFAATVADDRPVQVVERSKSAAADARQNLRGRAVKVVAKAVAGWTPSPAAVVVADPPQAGLERVGVDKVAATGADRLVLVSCDAASLGRDSALLAEAGYRHVESVLVDLFGHTGHIEAVTRYDRAPQRSGL